MLTQGATGGRPPTESPELAGGPDSGRCSGTDHRPRPAAGEALPGTAHAPCGSAVCGATVSDCPGGVLCGGQSWGRCATSPVERCSTGFATSSEVTGVGVSSGACSMVIPVAPSMSAVETASPNAVSLRFERRLKCALVIVSSSPEPSADLAELDSKNRARVAPAILAGVGPRFPSRDPWRPPVTATRHRHPARHAVICSAVILVASKKGPRLWRDSWPEQRGSDCPP